MDARLEALERAVQVSLANGGEDEAKTVARAEVFFDFLSKRPPIT